MTEIYLVDYLGIHCGMHYYLEAFRKILSEIPNAKVSLLSNFAGSDTEKPFFINHYQGIKLKKCLSLLRNLRRLRNFIKAHPDALFIYLTYGNRIDIAFMNIISQAHNHLIDIHEAIAQNVDTNTRLKSKFKEIYSSRIKNVISHSSRTDNFLNEYDFKNVRFKVPHFKYVFPKDYDPGSIPVEVSSAPRKDKINIMFFGNLNESKGVDILMEAVNKLSTDASEKLNVIIAGKDFDGAIDRVPPKPDRNVTIIRRHITDDELRFLYQNVDYLSLPYRKTSQSGILEMAFYFKRPIIASDVPYFRATLEKFPSFGIIAGNDAHSYAATLAKVASDNKTTPYFNAQDYARYEHRAEVDEFVKDFAKWIEKF